MNNLIKTKFYSFNQFTTQPTRFNVELNLEYADENRIKTIEIANNNNEKDYFELKKVILKLQRYESFKFPYHFNIISGALVFF